MKRIPLLSTLFLILSTLSIASASAPTFCKCTCFTNSTIIPLGPIHDSPSPPNPPPSSSDPQQRQQPPSLLLTPRASSSSCTQCNRAFCLKYNLPICKDAEEKDVVTSCFQRDSNKDRIIVWGFILGTAGLLSWAGIRKVIDSRLERQGQQGRDTSSGFLGTIGGLVGVSGGGGNGARVGGIAGGLTRRGTGGEGGRYSPLGEGAVGR
ncbi:hypothetical protein QBC40DRAFT_203125 [Triangularia verruculosa]|uniref:Uncharacterized protein n=1 Tax=Triangularia verruculosa TaxID=2587418 RepID=A0AAN6XFM7_9PEZI|nr:hypothetical protein QBC40DRAFT_203125 [Triangularia verruculosa]